MASCLICMRCSKGWENNALWNVDKRIYMVPSPWVGLESGWRPPKTGVPEKKRWKLCRHVLWSSFGSCTMHSIGSSSCNLAQIKVKTLCIYVVNERYTESCMTVFWNCANWNEKLKTWMSVPANLKLPLLVSVFVKHYFSLRSKKEKETNMPDNIVLTI